MRAGTATAVIQLTATILFLLTAASDCQSVSAPLYVALVRISDLATIDSNSRAVQSSTAFLRAAGYPVSPRLSQPPLARSLDADPAGSVEAGSAWSPTGLPMPTGPGGPTLNPLRTSGQPLSSSSSSTAVTTSQSNSSSSSSSSSSGGSSSDSGSSLHDSAAATSTRKLTRAAPGLQQSSFAPTTGFEGIATAAPAGTGALAAGPHHLLQARGAVVTFTNLSSSSGDIIPGTSRSVALSSLLAGAAVDCQGVYDPSAVYDHHANRFLLTATCGGQGRVLLAASATSDAVGTWFVFGLVADGVNSSLACTLPVTESALVDYTQISYNTDGVYITHKAFCPSNATQNGLAILALPKHAVYQGKINFIFPVYTSQDLQQAVSVAENGDLNSSGGSAGCSQLMPVVPQGSADVSPGSTYFVCEVPITTPTPLPPLKTVTVAALIGTELLWHYISPELKSNIPILAAQQVSLAAPGLPPAAALQLRQPDGAPSLLYAPAPRGFWNGAAMLSGGKLYIASPTLVASDRSSSSYSRRPAIAWAELTVAPVLADTETCPQSQTGMNTRAGWDWSVDHSTDWGSQFDVNYTQHHSEAFAPKLAATNAEGTGAAGNSSHTVVRAAGWSPLNLKSMVFWGMNFELQVEPCTCYRCYWSGAYYQYGGYNAGALGGAGVGYTAGNYFFAQGRMTRCQSTCTRCWYYGYPGNGAGNLGVDIADPLPVRPRIRSVNGQLTPVTDANSTGMSINTLDGLDAATLFSPCSRSARLFLGVQRQGIITKGGDRPLGLTFPTLAMGPDGQLLVAYTYSGPGNVTEDMPAYMGAGATLIPAGATSGRFHILQAGKGTIKPVIRAGMDIVAVRGDWAELSAAAVHPPSGRLYTAVHYASSATNLSDSVGSWINSWLL